MENASKALLMAAGVLLAIMVLTLGVFLFTNFGGTSSQIHDNIEKNQIEQFNSQFVQYVGKTNVTIYDVITMANLATENNRFYEFAKMTPSETNNYIAVYLNGTSIEYGFGASQSDIDSDYNQKILNEINSITGTNSDLPKYDVQTEISGITQRVYIVRCNEI